MSRASTCWRSIRGDLARELIERQTELCIGWDLANLVGQEAGDPEGPFDGGMGLIAEVDGGVFETVVEFRMTGGHDGSKVGQGAPADE